MEDAKSISLALCLGLVLILFPAVPVIFLFGAAEFSVWALDWIPGHVGYVMFSCVIIAFLAIFPAARGVATFFSGFAMLAFLLCLLLYSVAATYIEWGMLAVFVTALIPGVGVVLTGALSAVLSANWVVLGNIAFLLVLFVLTNLVDGALRNSAHQRKLRKAMEAKPSEAIIVPQKQEP